MAVGSSSFHETSWVESWTRSGSNNSLKRGGERNVASSPTGSVVSASSTATQSGPPVAQTVVMGFDVPSSSSSSSLHLKPQAVGLLSKALVCDKAVDEDLLPLLSPSFSTPTSSFYAPIFHHQHNAVFFPDVDLTLLQQAQERHEVFKCELVCNAYMIAARAYQGQFREDRSSVLSHNLLTALTLADFGLDAQTVASGLLADVLRQNHDHRSQLEEFMPSNVVKLVDRVTTISHISDIYRDHRSDLDDEKLRQMMLAMEDVKAVLVKLAGRVHDMKAINSLPLDKRKPLAQETLDIYSVVANRLGCWCLKAELEDLAFQALYPEEFENVRAQVSSRQDPAALEATIQAIKSGLDKQNIKYEDISGRPKNLYGVWCKMVNDGVTTVDKIFDVIALRVVVSGNKHDCYYAQRVIQQLYRCMPDRSKDFIKVIKKLNGYQSLHETIYGAEGIPVEVQIRTPKMHYIAEYGFAAHWKYKENLNNDDEWLDKEVQYKKWVMNYKLGVHDKKVRPSGSPPTDSSLKSLGAHYLDMSSHPEHHSKVDPFLMHERFKLQQPSRRTVRVMLQTQDSVEQRECSANVSVDELERELDVASLPGYVMTVNQKLPADRDMVLRDGDLLQILPLTQVSSRSPPERPTVLPSSSPEVLAPVAAGEGAQYWAGFWNPLQQRQQTKDLEHLDVFSLGSSEPVSVMVGFSTPQTPVAAL